MSAYHVVAADLLYEFFVGRHYIWCRPQRIPSHIFTECFLVVEVRHTVASGVVVEHSVKSYGVGRDYRSAHDEFGLKGA